MENDEVEAKHKEFTRERKSREQDLLRSALLDRAGNTEEIEQFTRAWQALNAQLDADLDEDWEIFKANERRISVELSQTKARFLANMEKMKLEIKQVDDAHAEEMQRIHMETAQAEERTAKRFRVGDSSTATKQLLIDIQDKLREVNTALLQSKVICVVCLDKPRSIVFLPCNHFAVCAHCFAQLAHTTCPVCRTQIDSSCQVHFA